MDMRNPAGQEPSQRQATFAGEPAASWDPYEVWLTRVKQPRERRPRRRLPERASAEDGVTLSADPSPVGRWSPWRRATSPRS